MARKIIAVIGGTQEQRTDYVASWYGARPDRRRIVKTADDIKKAMQEDHAAIIAVDGVGLDRLMKLADQLRVPLSTVTLATEGSVKLGA